jgi:copper chaperone CopZ
VSNEKRLLTKLIPIIRMDCPTCIATLEKEIRKLPGVKEVRGNYMTKTLEVTYDSDVVGLSKIETAIERIGYQIAYKKYLSPISKLKKLFRKKDEGPPETISDNDFAFRVLHASEPVAVIFSSPTCPACQAAKTEYAQIAKNLAGTASFYIMDISTSRTWHEYEITCIPTVLIFKDGQETKRLSILPQKEEIIRALTT